MMSNKGESRNVTEKEACMRIPPWYPQGHLPMTDYPFLVLQIQFIVIFILTQALHLLFFKHLRLPPLVSQLTAGILLCPKMYDGKYKALKSFHEVIFPEMSTEIFATITTLGLSLSFFVVGVKLDFSILRKNGRKSLVIGLLVLIVPRIINILIASVYGSFTHLDRNNDQFLSLRTGAAIIVLTPFPVIAILLNDLKLLNSELGRLALSTGIISEVASVSQLVLSKAIFAFGSKDTKEKKSVLLNFMGVIALILAMVFILRPGMNQIIKRTPKGRPVKEIYLLLVFAIALIAGLVTNTCGEFVMLGCYIAGVAIPEGPPLGSAIVNKFESFVLGMLLPFCITISATRADVFIINFRDKLLYGQALITISAFSTKILICVLCGLCYNMTLPDSMALGAMLSAKGFVDISTYNMVLNDKMLNEPSFAFFILVATGAAFVIPSAIKQLYNPMRKYSGYEKRDIMHCKPHIPLRILACIYRTDNVVGITNLLSMSGITRENPMILDVVHLIKLVGRVQPVFISHDLQQRRASNNMSSAYSEDVIWAMDKFKKTIDFNNGGLSMHLYTAVSPPKAMHEDICTLALDNLASLLILPFHRKLGSIHGSVEHQDHGQRALNISVLERAPCSVGILIHRGANLRLMNPTCSPLTSVVVQPVEEEDVILVGLIFIGGSDDREAVAYAKRMARGAGARRVKVLVIQLTAIGVEIGVGEENGGFNLIDENTIKGVKELSASNPHFNYMEKVVKEGPETARLLRSIVGDFDMIIVGRRFEMDCPQTSGLKEWTELPELGILGDLLASPDLQCRTSVLVIQQQRQWTWKQPMTS